MTLERNNASQGDPGGSPEKSTESQDTEEEDTSFRETICQVHGDQLQGKKHPQPHTPGPPDPWTPWASVKEPVTVSLTPVT